MYALYECYPDEDNCDDPVLMSENPASETEEMCSDDIPASTSFIPRVVFIVPYRDREKEQSVFSAHMTTILNSMSPLEYQIYYIHQCDRRPFNRGALKNIGFLVTKEKYPEHYRNITLVFNDIDTYPSDTGVINDYETVQGSVKHFYGYDFALGGIVSIKAGDFESVNGFPNYWAWGYEDNMLNQRVLKAKLSIDRSCFFKMNDPKIIQTRTTNDRIVNRGEFDRYIQNRDEGIRSISNVSYAINDETGFVDVQSFETEYVCKHELNRIVDISTMKAPFTVGYSARRRSTMNLIL